MLFPPLTSWRAHYARLQRSFERISQPYQSSVAYDDDLQHFFQDCFHLKDWIKNDPSSGVGAQIEAEVQAERPLRIAADLANAAKHLARITHREGAYVTSTNVTVHLGQNKPTDIEYLVTLADGSILVAQQVAKDAMASWTTVLAKLGLQP
jgi:hypothetical protein